MWVGNKTTAVGIYTQMEYNDDFIQVINDVDGYEVCKPEYVQE